MNPVPKIHMEISPDDSLLFPKFYLVPELEEWLMENVKAWIADRPPWMT